MSNVAKLKKQAAELELKKQFDKALAVYVKLLESFDEHADELDVALFNRVGDLMLRQGNVADAVDYYERAVDHYAEGGFFNNAIALCNKILRHSPGRTSVYYKLGKISAQKGFTTDAKQNFLEYAGRMQKAGRIDEAFRALSEFADLCPDQDDIRLMLAEQLVKANRKDDAIEQLQTLYAQYDSDGRDAEAVATLERMRAIDPSVEPRTGGDVRERSHGELIFLDLDEAPRAPTPPRKSAPVAPPARVSSTRAEQPREVPVASDVARVEPEPSVVEALEIERPTPTPPTARAATPPRAPTPSSATPVAPTGVTPLDGVSRIGDDVGFIENAGAESLLGLESTSLTDQTPVPSQTPSILDFEPTSLTPTEAPPMHRSSAPTHAMRDDGENGGGDLDLILPDEEAPPIEPRQSTSLDFDLATFEPTPVKSVPAQPTPVPTRRTPTPNDLPLMDVDVPTAPPALETPRRSMPDISFAASFDTIEPSISDVLAESDAAVVEEEDEPFVLPTPSVARKSTIIAAQSVDILRASVEGEPQNWSLRRELAEAMLDAGDRAGGLNELDLAMQGAETDGDLDLASAIAEEIARLEPDVVRHHQKRVEYAFRINDRGRLIEAYLALGDSLLRAEQIEKARTVYQRVIELAPDELRASTALETIGPAEPEPEPAPPPRRSSSAAVARGAATGARTSGGRAAQPPTPAPARSDDDFVNLGDWLRDDSPSADTRMVVEEQEPTGDEEADFADMLRKFKQGVAQNVDAEDYQSHYDLAIAYKEMGLLDEAIHEFQKALGSPANRLPTYEALGQCFIDKGQFKMASAILGRALNENAPEEQLVGVLYLLGRAAEEQGNPSEALGYYQRVFVLDIQFRDIAERMTGVEQALR